MSKLQKLILTFILILSFSLRSISISSNPPGLYWDEAAFGYDAYSILKIGHDHHGHFMPLLFESFGDWKLPGYFYLLIPSIAIFGLNEIAVRAPSVIFGSATVFIFFLLIKKITSNTNLSLLSAFFLAISPWHIQFSRGGFESIPALCFITLGTYLFLKSSETKSAKILTAALILFVLSMYSYHAYRIFTPLLVISLFLLYYKKVKTFGKKIILPLVVSSLIFFPLLTVTFTPIGSSRAISQSVFKPKEVEALRIDFDQKSKRPLRFLSGYIYPVPLYYSQTLVKAYFDHFSPTFLFLRGDQTGRHSQVDLGQLYSFEAILLAASVVAISKLKKIKYALILTWLLLAPIPAIIVAPTPHAYRSLQMSLPLAFFSSLGAYFIFKSKNKIIILMMAVFILSSFLIYIHHLFVHYPNKFANDWQDGYKQLVLSINKYQNSYDKIYVTNISQVPYIYFLLFNRYDPQKFLNENGSSSSFDKYYFVDTTKDVYSQSKILYAAPSWQKVDGKFLEAVSQTNGNHIYSLWEVNGQK